MPASPPPPIASLPADDRSRPLLSVMIPAYEPGPFLGEALRAILAQDRGAAVMQVAVVDDASPTVDVAALVRTVAPPGRVELHRNSRNLGLAGNWNRAITLARGHLVHLLHQDDLVLPGFYEHLLRGFADDPDVGMAFCRHDYVDEQGTRTRRSHRERWRAGALGAWLERISHRQRIQCPAAVVRRGVYERLGGFRDDLAYALDWEMWVRIAAAGAVWYEPRLLASYRRHGGSETNRLAAAGALGEDLLRTIVINADHLPADRRDVLTARAYRHLARTQLRDAARLLDGGQADAARVRLETARTALGHLPPGLARRWRQRELERLAGRCAGSPQRTT